MAGEARPPTTARDTHRAGLWSVGFGVAGVVGLLWTWAVSVLDDLNPPNAVRIPLILLLPIGVVGALAAGVQAVPGTGRHLGVAGMVTAGAAVLGFVVLLFAAG